MAGAIHWENPIYLSIDLGVFDPAFAPGSDAGADNVEINPKRDPQEITAMVAVKILKEVAARMLQLPIELT